MSLIGKYFEKLWSQAKKHRKEQILNLLEPPRVKMSVLLDCGCDSGVFSVFLAKKLKTKLLYGVEINKKVALQARKRGVKVKIADLNFPFPFQPQSFDVVVADQVIEHLLDLDNFVKEIKRVLKPGGYVIVSTENLASWHNIAILSLGYQPFTGPTVSSKYVIGFHPLTPNRRVMAKKYVHTQNMPPHTRVLTLTALIELFESYGLRIEEIKTSGYLPLPWPISQVVGILDKKHAFFITVKARKLQ